MTVTQVLWAATALAALAVSAEADPGGAAMDFAVMRNGSQIGTDRIRFAHDGPETTVQNDTHVAIGLGMLTLYRYDQSETERWVDGRLVALDAKTYDNGTEHSMSVKAKDGKLVVHADDKTSEAPPTAVPLSLWNPLVVDSEIALNTKDGRVQPMKVIDCGEEKLPIRGRERSAHHYEIVTTFSQDVWYDDSRQLVRVEIKGSDGSTIRYQLL